MIKFELGSSYVVSPLVRYTQTNLFFLFKGNLIKRHVYKHLMMQCNRCMAWIRVKSVRSDCETCGCRHNTRTIEEVLECGSFPDKRTQQGSEDTESDQTDAGEAKLVRESDDS